MSVTIRCHDGRVNTGMRRLRGAKWGLVAAGAALVLAGCGGSGSDGDWLGERRESGASSASAPGARGKATVTFTVTGGETGSDSVLERTAELMRQRAASAELEGVEIAVRDGRITLTGSRADEEALKSLGRTAELGFRPVTSVQPVEKGTCRESEAAASDALTTCGTGPDDATTRYVLEPVALPGDEISRAEAALDENVGTWLVNLDFTTEGADRFAEVTGRLSAQTPPQNQFAIVLDGEVLSAPSVSQAITGGKAQISGNFTERTAKELAAQLSTGALPLDLEASSVSRVPGSWRRGRGRRAAGPRPAEGPPAWCGCRPTRGSATSASTKRLVPQPARAARSQPSAERLLPQPTRAARSQPSSKRLVHPSGTLAARPRPARPARSHPAARPELALSSRSHPARGPLSAVSARRLGPPPGGALWQGRGARG
ncbi:preprotein translocase subunit SecD [Streptomyces sp. N35]|uniref:preprotein translocase subunit SecD n=1 Tax=Streptomyces sp. N35 TaxID=2795730 RepID=UPI0018F28603|nr:hypothetical protein [Streptomyces sp. N35]